MATIMSSESWSGPYRRISRPGRISSGSNGSGRGGSGSGGSAALRKSTLLLLLACVVCAALGFVLLPSSSGSGSHDARAAFRARQTKADADALMAAAAAAPALNAQQQRWPRGVPRSIKASRWEAAASAAPARGGAPGPAAAAAAAASSALGAIPPAACTGTSPSLPSVRPEFCEPLFCLRSATQPGVYIDLAFGAFTRLTFPSEAEAEVACGLPLRGQAGPAPPPPAHAAAAAASVIAGGAGTWAGSGAGARARGVDGLSAAASAAPFASSSSAAAAAASDDGPTAPPFPLPPSPLPPPPEVSFLLTVHDKPAMVVETVLELFRTAREARSVEFVVIDDGSDDDMDELSLVGAVVETHFRVPFRLVRNAKPVGFGAANMQAARLARGEFVALINSDALVTRGWLAALLAASREPAAPGSKGVGLAGPLFLDSEGRVMEAGGVVWSDASAANFGRRATPSHEHLYSRGADYMSAACLLARRSVFLGEIGGFDERYGFGYW